MKYLPDEGLENVAQSLSCVHAGDCRIYTRLETYTCKMTSDERKLRQYISLKLDVAPSSDHDVPDFTTSGAASSVETHSSSVTGKEFISRKTLIYLISTLNSVYPDYDFSDVAPASFVKLPSLKLAASKISRNLFSHLPSKAESHLRVGNTIWNAIDSVVHLEDCAVYEFECDPDMEPDGESGNVWSFYYFFYNKSLKRIVYFSSRAVSLLAPVTPEDGEVGARSQFEVEESSEGLTVGATAFSQGFLRP